MTSDTGIMYEVSFCFNLCDNSLISHIYPGFRNIPEIPTDAEPTDAEPTDAEKFYGTINLLLRERPRFGNVHNIQELTTNVIKYHNTINFHPAVRDYMDSHNTYDSKHTVYNCESSTHCYKVVYTFEHGGEVFMTFMNKTYLFLPNCNIIEALEYIAKCEGPDIHAVCINLYKKYRGAEKIRTLGQLSVDERILQYIPDPVLINITCPMLCDNNEMKQHTLHMCNQIKNSIGTDARRSIVHVDGNMETIKKICEHVEDSIDPDLR
jgi:hypothetical protein